MSMPPTAVCDRARQTKDARFDGLFFTGVRSTRIYCRPVCPAPTPKPQNIVYFPSAAAAAGAGYRPCLRCRPELSPGIQSGDQSVRRALTLIAEGWLEEGSVETLAKRVGVSPRHLRRLFLDKAGATPLQVHQAQRVLMAKQLLTETSMSITQVALAAGFASIRRFNDTFHARCGVAPSAFRRRAPTLPSDSIRLRLAYRPPFDFAQTLAVLSERALAGIERVTAATYERNVSATGDAAWIRVTADPVKPELILHAYGIRPQSIQALVRRVRRMFDLDADLSAAHGLLQKDLRLAASITRRPGLRIPGAWDGFELAVAEALGLFERAGEVPLLQRLLDRYGAATGTAPKGLDRTFPGSDVLATADLQNTIGAPARNAHAVRSLAIAVRDHRLDFSLGQHLDEFVDRFVACADLPRSMAHLVAWRALGDPDAWPIDDSTNDVIAAVDSAPLSIASRPWRGYAALHLAMLPAPQEPATPRPRRIVASSRAIA
jgi:AraC family transcriptional regulator, regulatory protein of adaptative response / DNA-3-methyladenine glycosylase II